MEPIISKPRKQRPRKDQWGNKRWFLNRKLHREDGPAIECANGDRHWYLNGELHRVDGPAIERKNGGEQWLLNGLLHRIGGPAVIEPHSHRYWYQNGQLHREDGPAQEYDIVGYNNRWWFHDYEVIGANPSNFEVLIDRIKREEYADQYL